VGKAAVVLDQLLEVVRDTKAEALLVSGDFYDRPVPPADAVRLLDDFLSRAVLGLKVPVLLIAGNHDSPDRLAFASSLLAQRGLHLFGTLGSARKPVVLEDAHGPVHLCAVPCAEPPLVRELLQGPRNGESPDDNIMATLTDREPVLDPMGRLLSVYPNLLHIERTTLTGTGEATGSAQDHRGLTDVELFRAFFSEVAAEALSSEEEEAFAEIVERLRREEREAFP